MTGKEADRLLVEVINKFREVLTESIDRAAERFIEEYTYFEQEPCDDAISREAVDKYIARLLSGYLYDGERERLEIFSAYLWELPSVTQKSGKWIIKDRYYHDTITAECSECRREVEMSAWTKEDMYDFCPNCGARMESEDKECTKKI